MDENTLPSFAISSLCAATASCSAASLGYGWATTGEANNSSSSPSLESSHKIHEFSSTSRPSTSFRHSDPKRASLRRPQSAVVQGSREAPWGLSPTVRNDGKGYRQSYQVELPGESLQETERSSVRKSSISYPEPPPALLSRSKSAWFHKLRPAVTPAYEHSPNDFHTLPALTPSLRTNESSVPFLPHSVNTANSRNRLVKRSTSQSLHGRHSFDADPDTNTFGTNHTFRTVFRRPATSHQRSAESRVQTSYHQHKYPKAVVSHRSSRPSIESLRQPYEQSRNWQWKPFFRKRAVRIKEFQDYTSRDPSSLFLGKKDQLRCVAEPTGSLPSLVMAASITARIVDHDFTATSTLDRPITNSIGDSTVLKRTTSQRMSQFREELPENLRRVSLSVLDNNETSPLAAAGVPVSNSSPTPFKVYRRKGLRKSVTSADDIATEGRSKAGLPRSVSEGNALSSTVHTHMTILEHSPTAETSEHSKDVNQHISAFNSRGNGMETSESDMSPGGSHYPAHNAAGSNAIKPSLTPRHNWRQTAAAHRGRSLSPFESRKGSTIDEASAHDETPIAHSQYPRSRVVSDQESAAGAGSDTEHSRVFSVNDEDIDAFSETNYDSTRTGGTNSSASAVRATGIENVFVEPGKEGTFTGEALPVVEERLSDGSLTSSNRPEQNDTAASFKQSSGTGLLEIEGDLAQRMNRRRLTSLSATNSEAKFLTNHSKQSYTSPGNIRDTDKDSYDEGQDSFWEAQEGQSGWHQQDSSPGALAHSDLRKNLSIGESNDWDRLLGDEPSLLSSGMSPPSAMSRHAKIDLWAYSEHNPANIIPDARPQTVHGKSSEIDSRRIVYRRFAHHHRSHSEPKIADEMQPYRPEMFQLGKKGASENWDSDFEEQFQIPLKGITMAFEDISEEPLNEVYSPPSQVENDTSVNTSPEATVVGRLTPGHNDNRRSTNSILAIPLHISNLQNTVRGQFKAIGELKMLVEELRRLIAHAERLSIKVTDKDKALREEALGIIQLSDAEEIELQSSHDKAGISSSAKEGPSSVSTNSARVVDFRANEASADSQPTSMAEAIVKNISTARPDLAAGAKKTNFDTMALKELVTRASICVSALKTEIGRAEGAVEKGSPAVTALKGVFTNPNP